MARTIMIMAGGTGGHVFPALAVAEYLREQGWRVVWLGAKTGMEATLVPKYGYKMAWVRFSGLRGKGMLRALALPANLLLAFWQSARAILAERPDVVLGMGGYISFPGGMMASLLRRPLAIHEQNSVAGLANKVLARLADRVLQAFPEALPGAQLSGNPVRKEIAALAAPRERFGKRAGRLKLLVLGGSLGAQALNETLPQALSLLPEEARPEITHQAGAKHIEALRAAYAAAGVRAETLAFIDDMARRYGEADVVLCRAGALTVAELACAGVAGILVPFPHAVDDHQSANAKFLSSRGAAILLPQAELSAQRLADLLRGLTRERLLDMAEKARALGRPDATEAVARVCMELAK
ncbi:MAG: undecaprenyldiphospho-muramoylpentapeptide beta-N-acetylglucosaminyltransferase [Betaproteobacteria bacterium]|nr:MAG: undecaprenyldiphospho-muramoylpentapeptide beta-N-acetylglucosaminyltransferase [Betaproteobacteria bacterium]